VYKQVHIIGSGAIGSLLAARIQLSMKALGIATITRHLRSTAVDQVSLLEIAQPVTLSTHLNQWVHQPQSSLAILPMKSYQLVDALCQYSPDFPCDSDVLLLHNGMVTDPDIDALSHHHTIFNGTTSHAAFKPNKRTCTHSGNGKTVVGCLFASPTEEKQQRILTLLNTALGPAQYSQNMRLALWEKVAINAMINPLTAMHNIKNGQLLAPRFESELTSLANEISQVMQAESIHYNQQQVLSQSKEIVQATAENYSSMHQDVHLGRKTEIDAINGFILRCADQHQISCPVLHRHYQAITAQTADA
jgi:2-dehydropantoate 2-reductase